MKQSEGEGTGRVGRGRAGPGRNTHRTALMCSVAHPYCRPRTARTVLNNSQTTGMKDVEQRSFPVGCLLMRHQQRRLPNTMIGTIQGLIVLSSHCVNVGNEMLRNRVGLLADRTAVSNHSTTSFLHTRPKENPSQQITVVTRGETTCTNICITYRVPGRAEPCSVTRWRPEGGPPVELVAG